MSRRFSLLTCAIFLAAAGLGFARTLYAQIPVVPPQTTTAANEPLTIDAAFAVALTSNPAIAWARFRRAIDLAGVDFAAERPNPDAHVEVEKETPKQTVGLVV